MIADIIRKLGWFPYVDKETPQATELRVRLHLELCDADESHTVLVAEDEEGNAAGYISVHWLPYLLLEGQEGYVSEVFVREEARGKGVGKALMKVVKELAEVKGCSRLMLLSERDRSPAEDKLYADLGFEERPGTESLILPLK